MTRWVEQPLLERFLSHVEKTDTCWLWRGAVKPNGYGEMMLFHPKRCSTTHRISWELFMGPIPAGLCVLHHCDVRNCVNPDHLFLGTRKDNAIDRDMKGRFDWANRDTAWGNRSGMCKYSEATIASLRQDAAAGFGSRELAERYGMAHPYVCSVIYYHIRKRG